MRSSSLHHIFVYDSDVLSADAISMLLLHSNSSKFSWKYGGSQERREKPTGPGLIVIDLTAHFLVCEMEVCPAFRSIML